MTLIKRLFRWTMSLAVVAGCVAAVLAWQGVLPVARGRTPDGQKPAATAKSVAKRPAGIAVTVAPVTPRSVRRQVQVVGTLHGVEEFEVAAKVDGRIVRLFHDVGDVVHPGDVLLEVDPTDLKLAATEVTRSLELELARLGLSAVPAPGFDVGTVPGVARARLLEKNARNKFERSQALLRKQALSREDLEQSETDYEVAQANTRQAVLDAEATLASIRQREALLESAQQKLRDTRVIVPTPSVVQERLAERVVLTSSAGRRKLPESEYVIAARMVSEGEMVNDSPATSLFRLVMDRPLKLKAHVPERHVSEIEIGQTVQVSVEAWPRELFTGTVARVNPTVDRENRTFEIEVRIPNEDRRLRAGSFAKAAVLTREEQNVPTIPESALVKFAGVVKVFVVRDGLAHSVPVEPGLRLDVKSDGRTETWQETTGALEPGDLVVTTGHSQLADETPVRIRETETPFLTEP
ncbi:MAG TPA: efflux RND transporter periplasmic adaptor subunit [Planctomycetaceae bacterium]|nr:efflux RND transporter periplasmic adaptor subunit [Planctomycetaceae bacterium]